MSAMTTNRLTAQPWAASKAAKLATQEETKPGWGVCAMDCTMAVSDPAAACGLG